MKYHKRPPLSAREFRILILIGVVTIVVLGALVSVDVRISRGLGGGGGFFAPWQGARAFLFQHTSPYSGDAARWTEQKVYGRPAQPGQKPYVVTMPFFLLLVYFPIAALSDPAPQHGLLSYVAPLSDPAIARGFWLFINEIALIGTAALILRLIDWQPRPLLRVAFTALALFCFYPVAALFDGGPAILLGLLYAGILFAYSSRQDELAGALLAFALFSWEVGLLFMILLIWKIFYEKRWRVLAGFGMTSVVLLVISLLIYPGWIFPYLRAVLVVARAPFGITTGAVLRALWPTHGARAAQLLTVLLVVLLLYEWAATRDADPRRFVWAAYLTLAVTPLIGIRTETSNLAVLYPALALMLAATTSRWRAGYWLAALLMLIVLLVPWAFFVRAYALHEAPYYDYIFLFYPLFTILGLYWTRWWFLRPPRTWFDHIRSGTKTAPRDLLA